jgi:hypothetical protein
MLWHGHDRPRPGGPASCVCIRDPQRPFATTETRSAAWSIAYISRHCRMLTARAATMIPSNRLAADCTIMSSFAH